MDEVGQTGILTAAKDILTIPNMRAVYEVLNLIIGHAPRTLLVEYRMSSSALSWILAKRNTSIGEGDDLLVVRYATSGGSLLGKSQHVM